ncbi:MAG: hypothetical protein J5858_06120, partial [Lentisphaeria bacterium]|nr:hypothetical protein [Lentisphaeria bacterium]
RFFRGFTDRRLHHGKREQIHLQHSHFYFLSVGCCQMGARQTGARQSHAAATSRQPKEIFWFMQRKR